MLYSFGIEIALLLLRVVALFSKKIAHFLRVRSTVVKTVQEKIKASDRVLWFHCASLGEFEQARPLIVSCKKEYPNHKIAITFFSPSGYDVQKDYPLADVVTYLPLDQKKSLLKFLKALRPEILFLIKYEFWPNLLAQTERFNIPVFSIASIFRKEQPFFKSYGFYQRALLKKIKYFFVQNESSQKLLGSINIKNTLVIGDTRIDRVLDIRNQNNTNNKIAEFIQNKTCFVIGSSWSEDIEIISKTVDSKPDLKTIIAPHNVDKETLLEVERQFEQPIARWSELSSKENLSETNILLIDSIGILTTIYSYADIAYVGGGMGTKGLHNTLEPAVFGIPVLIGKNYKRYQEANDLVGIGSLISVTSAASFDNQFSKLFLDKKKQQEMGTLNLNYIKNQAGATAKIQKKLKEALKGK